MLERHYVSGFPANKAAQIKHCIRWESNRQVFKFCSPSRSSAISARLPIHVNQENSATVQPWSGIMANFTTFPERLKEAGYATAQGKPSSPKLMRFLC